MKTANPSVAHPRTSAHQTESHMLLAVAMIILGLLAMAAPWITGLAITWIVGAILAAGGILRLIWAFRARSFGRGILAFLLGAISIIAGGVMIFYPLLGLASLTLVLAIYFLTDGLFDLIAAFRSQPERGRWWLIALGLLSLALA